MKERTLINDAPLGLLQEEMWQAEQTTTTPRENVFGAFRLQGQLDVSAFAFALQAVVNRHEALRTKLIDRGTLLQRIEGLEVSLPAENVPDLDAASALANEEARTRIDLCDYPLWRVRLLRVGPHDHVFAYVFHHIILDGWSLQVFLRDLSATYKAFTKGGKDVPLPPLLTSYQSFCASERELLADDAMTDRVRHWQTVLPSPLPVLTIPTDFPRTGPSANNGARLPTELGSAISDEITQLARSLRTTVFAIFLAAFGAVIREMGDASDVVIGVPSHNRTRRELQPLIGYFANVLSVPLQVVEEPFAKLVQKARHSIVRALKYPELPPELLMRELYGVRGVPYAVYLDVQTSLPYTYSFAPLTVSGMAVANDVNFLDFELFLRTSTSGLRGELTYDSDLFRRERAESLWTAVNQLLVAVSTHGAEREVSSLIHV